MDLNEHSTSKVVKPKRGRQPNWTEHEKQLFLSLTRKHQAILENKGSNSMILRRKSEAWIEIASHMNAAGYNRSIDKLKQRLGRIRAADAKGFKEALEKSSVANYANINDKMPATHGMFAHEEDRENTRSTTSPNIMANDLQIKVEITTSSEDESNNADSICPSSTSSVQQSNIRLEPPNLKSLDALNNTRENDKDGDVLDLATTTNLLSPLAVAENDNALNLKTQSIDNVGSNDQTQVKGVEIDVTPTPRVLPKVRTSSSFRLSALRNLTATEQRSQEIHKYRVAIQRERLHTLHIQRKRDRILHRKEVEIQNLKLQVLRNITNETQDENRFNF